MEKIDLILAYNVDKAKSSSIQKKPEKKPKKKRAHDFCQCDQLNVAFREHSGDVRKERRPLKQLKINQKNSAAKSTDPKALKTELLNDGFILDDGFDDVETPAAFTRSRKQRRLSGRFLVAANNCPQTNSQEEIFGPGCEVQAYKLCTNSQTIAYYTDQTVELKPTKLETIFERPHSREMSVQKVKRFVNFSQQSQKPRANKRSRKVIKYNLWTNMHPVSMGFFKRKMADVEME